MRTIAATLTCLIFLVAAFASGIQHAGDSSWKTTEAAATRAAREAHFAEAEKLLLANLKTAENLAQTSGPKDERLPTTLFDLAQVYRAEGKYSAALPLYEQALQIHRRNYGAEATQIADVYGRRGRAVQKLE